MNLSAEGEVLLSGQLEDSAWDCVMLVFERDDYDPRDCVRFVDVSLLVSLLHCLPALVTLPISFTVCCIIFRGLF